QNTDRTTNNRTQAPVDHQYEAISGEFDWSQASRSFPALTAGKQATVSLAPCPRGVDVSGSPTLGGPQGAYPVYIEDGKDSEASYVVGGRCTSGVATGTVIFTPHSSHAASRYTLRSASAGIQEAINATCGAGLKWSGENGYCRIIISPTGPQP